LVEECSLEWGRSEEWKSGLSILDLVSLVKDVWVEYCVVGDLSIWLWLSRERLTCLANL
jgi:hypothetical protein